MDLHQTESDLVEMLMVPLVLFKRWRFGTIPAFIRCVRPSEPRNLPGVRPKDRRKRKAKIISWQPECVVRTLKLKTLNRACKDGAAGDSISDRNQSN